MAPSVEQAEHRGCEVARPGRCAVLVGDDPKRRALGGEAQHGEHEIRTPAPVEPAGAHDDMVGAPLAHCELAVPFGPPVRRSRRGRRVLGDGRRRGAVEHVVSAHMTASNAGGRARAGHDAGAGRVHCLSLGLVLLGGVDQRPRRAVDDRVGPRRVDRTRDRDGVGDIARLAAQADHVVPVARALVDEVAAELSGRAEHQILQRRSPCDRPAAGSPATSAVAVRARRASGRRA